MMQALTKLKNVVTIKATVKAIRFYIVEMDTIITNRVANEYYKLQDHFERALELFNLCQDLDGSELLKGELTNVEQTLIRVLYQMKALSAELSTNS